MQTLGTGPRRLNSGEGTACELRICIILGKEGPDLPIHTSKRTRDKQEGPIPHFLVKGKPTFSFPQRECLAEQC